MDRRQVAEECAEVEKLGGSVRDYLTCCGCISPWGTWYRLQKEELGRKEDKITDGKGGDDVRKLTLEDKKNAVQIAMEGGDPLKFLKDLGVGNPSATWLYIKKCLKARDPGQYEKLLCSVKHALPGGGWETWPAQEPKDKKPEEKMTVLSENLKKAIEEPVRAAEFQRYKAVAMEDDFMIYGLKTKIGEFIQASGGRLCWYKTANEMISMPAEDWKKILEIVPKVMNIMGL